MLCDTCGIPYLQFDLFIVDRDHARAKLDANRQVVNLLEPLVGKLQEQARLAHARVADDNVFEEVGVAAVQTQHMHAERERLW